MNDLQDTIAMDGVAVRRGRSSVLRNLSLHVPATAVYGLLGPSGCGKTAVLQTLATLLPIRDGTAFVASIDVRRHPDAVRERIGYLPDGAAVYRDLTVAEHLDFYAAAYRVRPTQRRRLVDELLELFDLTGQRSTPASRLSRGMRQRLNLARCLVHDPPVLLLDDPASGLDASGRADLGDILLELSRLGKTVLMTLPAPSDLSSVCTHLGLMRDGTVVAEGPAEEMTEDLLPDGAETAAGETEVSALEGLA